jgi:hypothetical protein
LGATIDVYLETATDSLGRNLTFTWYTPRDSSVNTITPSLPFYTLSSLQTVVLLVFCPEGVSYWDNQTWRETWGGTFECKYPYPLIGVSFLAQPQT